MGARIFLQALATHLTQDAHIMPSTWNLTVSSDPPAPTRLLTRASNPRSSIADTNVSGLKQACRAMSEGK